MYDQVDARVLTAQDIFKAQYSRTLRWSVLGALALLVLAVLVMPEYRPTPYRLSEEAITIVEIEMEVQDIEKPPPPVVRPLRPIEPVSDLDPDAEVPPDIADILMQVQPNNPGWTGPPDDTPFVATSTNPKLLQGAVADYPEMARLAGMQGTVVVEVLVDVDGSVARVRVLKGVHKLLNDPALAAARKLRFSPGMQRDMPVPCRVAVPFRFYLH